MTAQAIEDAVRVSFYVYSWPALPLPVAAERLRRVVPVPLVRYRGSRRGEYYRWSDDQGADLLLQRNVPDEDGQPLEPGAPAHAVLLYATDPPGPVLAALAALDGLVLVAWDVVEVPAIRPVRT